MTTEPEGRLVWMDVDPDDGRKKLYAFYFVDKETRKEALRYVGKVSMDYEEEWAFEVPGDEQRLEYRRK